MPYFLSHQGNLQILSCFYPSWIASLMWTMKRWKKSWTATWFWHVLPTQHPEAYCPQSQSVRTHVRTVTAAQFLPKKEENEKRREFTIWTSRCVKYYGTDVYIAYRLNPDSGFVTWLFLWESHLKFKESESLVENTLLVNYSLTIWRP